MADKVLGVVNAARGPQCMPAGSGERKRGLLTFEENFRFNRQLGLILHNLPTSPWGCKGIRPDIKGNSLCVCSCRVR